MNPIIVNKPSYLTLIFPREIPYFEVRNSTGDLCFFRYLDVPSKRYDFNIIIPESYVINPEPVECYMSGAKRMINDFTLPTPDYLPPTSPEFITDMSKPYVAMSYIEDGKIILGSKFYELPEFARIFTQYHEIGHWHYNGQIEADTFALLHFCKAGFNPSSAIYAIKNYTSHCKENADRVNSLYANVLKYQC
jgi:hypothetical protein